MEERVKKLNFAINDFLVSMTRYPNLIYDYLIELFSMSQYLKEQLDVFFESNDSNIDISQNISMSLSDRLNIIRQFYSDVGINIDLEKYLNDGTIGLIESNTGETPFISNGKNSYSIGRDFKLVDAYNNGTVSDIPVLVHEIGHLRNQPDNVRGQVNDLFTEGLARTDELLVLDYLDKLGYEEGSQSFRLYLLKCSYRNVIYTHNILKLLVLFKEYGDVSLESYREFYGSVDDYEEMINTLESKIYDKAFFIRNYVNYMFDTFLSSYLFINYKNDPSYIAIINQLNSCSMGSDFYLCLRLMGIDKIDSNGRNKFYSALDEYLNFVSRKEVKKTSI